MPWDFVREALLVAASFTLHEISQIVFVSIRKLSIAALWCETPRELFVLAEYVTREQHFVVRLETLWGTVRLHIVKG